MFTEIILNLSWNNYASSFRKWKMNFRSLIGAIINLTVKYWRKHDFKIRNICRNALTEKMIKLYKNFIEP